MRNQVSRFFQSLEQSPLLTVTRNTDGVTEFISTRKGSGYVMAMREEDDVYKLMRVEPDEETRSEAVRKHAVNPTRSPQPQKKGYTYQLKRAQLPALLEGGNSTQLHANISWQRNTTRLRTAKNPNQLKQAWDRF